NQQRGIRRRPTRVPLAVSDRIGPSHRQRIRSPGARVLAGQRVARGVSPVRRIDANASSAGGCSSRIAKLHIAWEVRSRKRFSGALAGDNLIVLAFADAAEWVILAKGIAAEPVPSEDAAEVGVADEHDSVHVVNFAFHPFGPGPHAGDTVDHESRVALFLCFLVAGVLSGSSFALGIEKDSQPEAGVVRNRRQAVVDREAMLSAGVAQVVD